MSTQIELGNEIQQAGEEIFYAALSPPNTETQERVNSWVETHDLTAVDQPLRVVANQTAFNFVLKSTVYRERRRAGASLSALTVSDAARTVQRAGEWIENPAFESSVLDEIAVQMTESTVEALLSLRDRLCTADQPADRIGSLFEQITPQDARRGLGQYRTPTEIADLMANWCVQPSVETVLDPGIGAGALSAAVFRQADVPDLLGVEVDPLATVMAATTLQLTAPTESVTLTSGDFLDVETDTVRADAVIANPPYSRHHALDERYKQRVNEQAEREVGRDLSALSPLYAYFYSHATACLSESGRMSFITPAEFLDNGYGEELKRLLLESFDVQAVVMTDPAQSVFDTGMTTSCVTFLSRNPESVETPTRFVFVSEWPGVDELTTAVTGNQTGETPWGYINPVRQHELAPETNWTRLFDPIEITEIPQLVPFESITDEIKRGIATGRNDFFCLDAETVKQWEIDTKYLARLVRSASCLAHCNYTDADWRRQRDAGKAVYLLYNVDRWRPSLQDTQVWEYIQNGKTNGADESYLAKNRDPWYVVDRRPTPDILFKYMSRDGGDRFVLNEAGVRNLNNLHGITLDEDWETPDIKALLAYLNSSYADELVQRSGRTYVGGLSKVEPGELKQIPVLDVTAIDSTTRDKLAEAFDQLCHASRASADRAAAVSRIDELLETVIPQ